METNLKIFEYKPEGFKPLLTIVGCYCTYQGRILLLKRHPETFSGEKWCLPAGKLELDETRPAGAVRELVEETRITPTDLFHIGTVYLRFPDYEYDFDIYHAPFTEKPELKLNLEEHTEGAWVTHEETKNLPLIHGGGHILEYCRNNCF